MKTVPTIGVFLLPTLLFWSGPSLWAAAAPAAEDAPGVASQPAEAVPGGAEMPSTGEGPTSQSGEMREQTGLTFAEDVAGQILIRDADDQPVTQVSKVAHSRVFVRLDPGRYEIEWQTEPQLSRTVVSLAAGERMVINRARLQLATMDRGSAAQRTSPGYSSRRPVRTSNSLRACRLTLDTGGWARGGAPSIVITDDGVESRNGGFLGGMSFGYRLSPEWMVSLGVTSRLIETHDAEWSSDDPDRASFVTSFSVGSRFYLPPLAARSAAKPYLSVGLGPIFGTEVESRHDHPSDHRHHHDADTVRNQVVLGSYLGGGLDIYPATWLVLGSDVAYQFAPKFSEPVGGRREADGLVFSFQMGVNFGGRLARPSRH